VGKMRQVLTGTLAEWLTLLRSVDSGQPNLVLQVVGGV
jgi:hypothetical protein